MDAIELEARRSEQENHPARDGVQNDLSTPAAEQAAPSHDHPTGIRLIVITIGLVLSVFLAALDQTIVATAIPSITTQFGSISNIAWYGSAYVVTQTAFQSAWGKAYKFFPLNPTWMLSVFIFEVGNAICATAPSSDVLIFGRVVAGLGSGGMLTGSFIIIALTAREEYRAAYMGVVGVTFGISSVVGPLLGGVLTDGVGWRWCFWINLPIGFLATTIMFFAFRAPPPFQGSTLRERIIHMDLGGGVLISGILTCFITGLHRAATYSWSNYRVILSFVGSGLLFICFIANERFMGDRAMVQAHLIRNKRIASNLGYIFFLAGAFFPFQFTLPVQFQSVDALSASQSGVRLIPLILGVSIFSLVSNGLLTFWRHYKPFLLAGALLATAGASSIYTLNAHASTSTWIGFELLTGMGVGLALQIPMIANQAAVGAEDIAPVTALSLFIENCGTAVFVSSGETALTQALVDKLGKSLPSMDPHTVLNAGATQIRNVFSGRELEKVLEGYLYGCKVSHIIGISCGVAASLISISDAGPAVVREVKMRLKKSHSG